MTNMLSKNKKESIVLTIASKKFCNKPEENMKLIRILMKIKVITFIPCLETRNGYNQEQQ